MRTNDPTESPKPWQPLGEKVQPKAPEPVAQRTQGPSGIVTGADGRMRTTHHPFPGND